VAGKIWALDGSGRTTLSTRPVLANSDQYYRGRDEGPTNSQSNELPDETVYELSSLTRSWRPTDDATIGSPSMSIFICSHRSSFVFFAGLRGLAGVGRQG
jgi:hypothetical protein